MGGVVAICVRKASGEVRSQLQWTNVIPGWLNHLALVDDPSWYVEQMFNADCSYLSNSHIVAPVEYGIIVIDEVDHTIYSFNDYSTPGRRNPASIYMSESPKYIEMKRRGMLSLWDNGVEVEGYFSRDPLACVFDECRALNREEMRDLSHFYEVRIDFSPWKIEKYDYYMGCRKLLDTLLGKNFPLTDEDIVTWEQWIAEGLSDG